MALTLEEKQTVVAEVAEVAASAHSAVAAEYRGLSVSEMTDLRQKARAANVYLRVVKNTLARRAVAGTEFESMGDALQGPLMLAFSREEPGSAARVLRDFAKDNDKLVPKLVSVGGQTMDGSEIGRGLVAYSCTDARAIAGHKSGDIEKLLGYRGREELIHRDDLVMS